MMRACATASGGVIFIPDTLERKKTKPVSYRDIAPGKPAAKKRGFFRKLIKPKKEAASKAA